MSTFALIIPLVINLLIFGFIAYFLINVLQFMRNKNHNDEYLAQKINEISKKLDEMKKN